MIAAGVLRWQLASIATLDTYLNTYGEQVYYPSHTLYVAPSGYSPDGRDVLRQSQTTPPLTYCHPAILSKYNLHLLSRSTRPSTLICPQETFEALDSTPRAGYVVGDAENPEAFMPPDARYRPDPLVQTHSGWNAQGVGVAGSFTAHPPHLVEGDGRPPTVPFCKPPPPDAHSFPINDAVQIAPTLTAEYGPSTLEGSRGYREQQTFYDPNDFRFSPSGHPLTGRLSAPACPQSLVDVADRTATNVGTGPPSMYYTAPQAGHGGNYEWVGGNEYGHGNVAPSFPYSNEPRHQQPQSFHPVHRDIGNNLSMHGASPEADDSHIEPSKDAPAAGIACGHCGWRDNDDKECGELLTYPGNLASHFAEYHGIKNMASDVPIMCRWCSPGEIVKRESLLRHLREYHLGYRRRKKGVAQPSLQFPSVTRVTRSTRTSNASTPVESPTFIFHYPPHGPSPTHTRPPCSRDFPTTSFPVDISPG